MQTTNNKHKEPKEVNDELLLITISSLAKALDKKNNEQKQDNIINPAHKVELSSLRKDQTFSFPFSPYSGSIIQHQRDFIQYQRGLGA